MAKKNIQMTREDKKALQRRFFAELGPSAEVFKEMFYNLPTVAFNMKDSDCRIMAINRLNCEICNIKDEWEAIGRTSAEIFPETYAANYMALDRQVMETGQPILGNVTQYPADRSMSATVTNIYPLRNASGKVIGTARSYYLSPAPYASERYGQIQSVATYVAKHYAEDITVPRLVALTGLSETAFKQAFAKAFSMSPGRYLITIRLNAVRKLLESTNKLISEIALETGFFDQSHLTRIFKKERGMTPGEYRRNHQTNLRTF